MSEGSLPSSMIDFAEIVKILGDEELEIARSEFLRSQAKMKETNQELTVEIDRLKLQLLGNTALEDRDEIMDDLQLYKDSIAENVVVLDHQSIKIRSIETELTKRGIPITSGPVEEVKEGVYL